MFVFTVKLGGHELTADGRIKLQCLEKPCDNRLTSTQL
jgi:hypothetical protein